ADRSAAAAAPPLAATASLSGASSANRSISTNGGDWLRTSWVIPNASAMVPPPVAPLVGARRNIRERGITPKRRKAPGRAASSALPPLPTLPIAMALMASAPKSSFVLSQRHLLGIEGLSPADITGLLDLAEEHVELNRQ